MRSDVQPEREVVESRETLATDCPARLPIDCAQELVDFTQVEKGPPAARAALDRNSIEA
jgi:hypothetical protein